MPQNVFDDIEKAALRPLLPSHYEAAPTFLVPAAVNGQPYVLHKVLTTRFGGRHSTMRRLGVYDVPMGIPRMGDRKEGARRPLSSCRRYPIPPIRFLIDSSPSMCMTCDL